MKPVMGPMRGLEISAAIAWTAPNAESVEEEGVKASGCFKPFGFRLKGGRSIKTILCCAMDYPSGMV